MPTLSRWFIKAGILYFLLSMVLAILLKFPVQPKLAVWISPFNAVYYHFLGLGWITQIIFGVSHWMFPRYTKEFPRGQTILGWLVFITLNAGLLLRAITEPFMQQSNAILLKVALTAAAVLQVSAAVFYALHIWPRVKEKP